MKRIIIACTIIVTIAFVQGCFYDKAELVYPNSNNNCDTANVRYSVEIVNILSNNCYVCHGGNASGGAGIKLDTYTGLKNMVNNGLLLKAITHSPGASPMPKGGAKMPDCNINRITAWVNAGAPQN